MLNMYREVLMAHTETGHSIDHIVNVNLAVVDAQLRVCEMQGNYTKERKLKQIKYQLEQARRVLA